ncbi:MAG: peptide chain release factor 2 [Alphaproteobacteria bacterium]
MHPDALTLKEKIDASQAVLRRCLDWENLVKHATELNTRAEDPNLWNNQAEAQKLLKERRRVDHLISTYERMEREKNDALGMIELASAENDAALIAESMTQLKRVAEEVAQLELESLLSGEADGNNCFIEIHPGAGGTESQDWAFMLFRMYLRWAERRGFKVEIVDEQSGEEAGIKSATLRIEGLNAYGWAKTESGVHRLVRISPFDSNARRHTSFASVWVYPEVDENINIVIEEKDVRVDTFRSSGAGGQNGNKVASAVRRTHIPTNVTVACQNQRSQHQNRAEAWNMLRARLYELELQKKEAATSALNAQKTDNAWGHQIRSYVLHPYQMVKDLRTGAETSSTQAVLDGDIDMFINASLASRVKGSVEKT